MSSSPSLELIAEILKDDCAFADYPVVPTCHGEPDESSVLFWFGKWLGSQDRSGHLWWEGKAGCRVYLSRPALRLWENHREEFTALAMLHKENHYHEHGIKR